MKPEKSYILYNIEKGKGYEMSKLRKIALGLGVATGFGVSMMPLTSYATSPANCPEGYGTCTLDTSVIVNPVISMTIDSYGLGDATSLECASYDDPNCTGGPAQSNAKLVPGGADLTTMYSTITVSTNDVGGYTLTLIDADEVTDLATPLGETISAINSKPAAASAATPNPGWAVSIGDTDVWQQMPNGASANGLVAAGTAITVTNYTPDPAAPTVNHQSTVHYGVAATADQPVGTYSDTVVYTATTKN